MQRFFVPLVFLIAINIAGIAYVFLRDTSARVVLGPENEITRFDKDRVLADGDAQSLQPVIFEVPLDPVKLIASVLMLEAPVLAWLGLGTWKARLIGRRRRSVALIGEGGVGKTTLLEKHFMNNNDKANMTKQFQPHNINRYKDGQLNTFKFYDTVGQSMADSVRRVLNGERAGEKVSDIMIMLSLFPVIRESDDWIVVTDTPLKDLPNSEIVKSQKRKILNLEALDQFLMSLDKLERITILFNQIDLIVGRVEDVEEFCNGVFPEAANVLRELEQRFYKSHGRSIETPIRYISAENGTEYLPSKQGWRAFEPFDTIPDRKRIEHALVAEAKMELT